MKRPKLSIVPFQTKKRKELNHRTKTRQAFLEALRKNKPMYIMIDEGSHLRSIKCGFKDRLVLARMFGAAISEEKLIHLIMAMNIDQEFAD